MKDKSYIEKSFIDDIGFENIKSWLVKQTSCKQNINYFEKLCPIFNGDNLADGFSLTDELLKSTMRKEELVIPKLSDMSTAIKLLEKEDTILEVVQFEEIRSMLSYYWKLKKKLKGSQFKKWKNRIPSIDNLKYITTEINRVIDDQSNIRDNASKELNKIIISINKTESTIQDKIKIEIEKYSKLGFLRDNKIIFRSGKIMLAVNSSNKRKVKGVIDGFSSTRQTCFIQPISLVELTNKLSELELDKKKEMIRVLRILTSKIAPNYNQIDIIYELIKLYDQHLTKALFAYKINAIEPIFSDSLILKNAINPIFSLANKKYVPLNISLKKNDRTIIISGPNSGGKTVVIKSIGLYSVMAQCGLYIPASNAELPIFKSFLSDIGDKQSIKDDLSTFSAHMKSISNIIQKSNENSLIIIDEMGTGTDPDIGASLSISILNKLTDNGSLNLCTTHLNPLKIWADENQSSKNASMEFDSQRIEPTYILRVGAPGSSYGIEIAERMGLGRSIIKNASKSLNRESFKMERLLSEISNNHKKSLEELSQLKNRKKQITIKEDKLNSRKEKLDKELADYKENSLMEANEFLLSYRKKIELMIENIKANNASKESIKEAKKYVSQNLDKINNAMEKNKITSGEKYIIGQIIYINKFEAEATILQIDQKTKKAKVDINNKRVTINISDISKSITNKKESSKNIVEKYNITPLESLRIDVRGKRVDEAIHEIEKFLDKVLLTNYKTVDILHGKGTRALQEAIHEHLNKITFIDKFNFAPINEGGAGITIVEFL